MNKMTILIVAIVACFGVLLNSGQEQEIVTANDVEKQSEYKVMETKYSMDELKEMLNDYTDEEILAYFLASHNATLEEKSIIAAIIVSGTNSEDFSESLRSSIITKSYSESSFELFNKEPTEEDKEIAQKSIAGEIKTEYTSYVFIASDVMLDMDKYPGSLRTENYVFK